LKELLRTPALRSVVLNGFISPMNLPCSSQCIRRRTSTISLLNVIAHFPWRESYNRERSENKCNSNRYPLLTIAMSP
jgi:hypothetical protein